MRIRHLNSLGEGGAARAACRLHEGLQKAGCESEMLVAQRQRSEPGIERFLPRMTLPLRVLRRLRQHAIDRDRARYCHSVAPESLGVFGDDRSRFQEDLFRLLPPCDIVNLHWVVNFIDFRSFFSMAPLQTPVVWTLHDMNPFTGGCHYDYGCGKFTAQCGACPQLQSENPADLSFEIWRRKCSALARLPVERFRIVAPSVWLANEARRSSLFGRFEITTIPNGLDTNEFAPRDQAHARAFFGIPLASRVVLFVAASVDDPRKGFRFAAAAVDQLKRKDVMFVVVGDGKLPVHSRTPCIRARSMDIRGIVETDREQRFLSDRFFSLAYSAADVCVVPSTAENLPQTVVEAMACGVPVVGFNVGGIPDLVQPGATGHLVAPGDAGGMAEAIETVLADDTARGRMGVQCRELVLREFAVDVQVRRYQSLYESLLSSAKMNRSQ